MKSVAWGAAFAALIFAALCAVGRTGKTADTPASAQQIIEKENQFAFTDNSSYYLFHKNHTFESGPVGESGRHIKGTWKTPNHQEGAFVIEGQWGWINGTSKPNDFRRMTLTVYPHGIEPEVKGNVSAFLAASPKIYRCYFVINELVPIAAPKLSQAAFAGVPVGFMDAVAHRQKTGAQVTYTINRDARVTLGVFSRKGEKIVALGSLTVPSGVGQEVRWDGRNAEGHRVASGEFIMRIRASAGGRTAEVNKPFVYHAP